MGTCTVTKGGRWFEGAQQLLVTLNCCIEYVPSISAVHYSDVHGGSNMVPVCYNHTVNSWSDYHQ